MFYSILLLQIVACLTKPSQELPLLAYWGRSFLVSRHGQTPLY